MARLEIDIVGNLDKLHKGLNDAESGLQRFASKAQKIGTGLSLAVTAPILALGAASVKSFSEVENKLREVNTLFGLTGAEAEKNFGDLEKIAGQASRELGILQNKVVPGLYNAISAGVPKENALEFIKVAGKAAIAGVTDINVSIDGLTSIVNAFNKDFSEVGAVADSVFAAIQGGKTTFEELSASIFNIAPAAAASKVSIEEINAAIATLTASGTPTKVATTQLRAALTGLQRPSEELDKIFKALGFTNAKAAIEAKGLGFALDAVKKSTGGNNGALQELLGSVEAVAAANVLAGSGAEKFSQELERQANASGAANKAFEEADKSFARQIERTGVLLNNFSISIGKILAPALLKLNKIIESTVGFLDGLSDTSKTVIVVIAGIAAAIGPLLLGIGTAIKLLPVLTAGFVKLKAAVIAATGPFGLIAIAVGAAIFLLIDLNKELNRTSKISGEVKADLLAKKIEETNKFLDAQVLKYRELLPQLTEEQRINKILVFELGEIRKQRNKSVDAIKAEEDALIKWGLEALKAAKTVTNLGSSTKLTFEEVSKLADKVNAKLDENESFMALEARNVEFLKRITQETLDVYDKLSNKILQGITPKKVEIKDVGIDLGEVAPNKDILPDIDTSKESKFFVALANLKTNFEAFSGDFQGAIEGFVSNVKFSIQDGLFNAFNGLGQALGEALATGQNVVKALGASLLKSIGAFLGDLGQQLIAFGVAGIAFGSLMEAIKKGGPLSIPAGIAAIGAGIALVAISSAIQSRAGQGLSGGGSGGATTSGISAQSYGGSGLGTAGLDLSGEFTVRGTDLVYIVNRQQEKNAKG